MTRSNLNIFCNSWINFATKFHVWNFCWVHNHTITAAAHSHFLKFLAIPQKKIHTNKWEFKFYHAMHYALSAWIYMYIHDLIPIISSVSDSEITRETYDEFFPRNFNLPRSLLLFCFWAEPADSHEIDLLFWF